jgi:hypothetical protein
MNFHNFIGTALCSHHDHSSRITPVPCNVRWGQLRPMRTKYVQSLPRTHRSKSSAIGIAFPSDLISSTPCRQRAAVRPNAAAQDILIPVIECTSYFTGGGEQLFLSFSLYPWRGGSAPWLNAGAFVGGFNVTLSLGHDLPLGGRSKCFTE